MFDADRPIVKKEQDRLNRTVFAQYLARCLIDHKDKQSLVVGLYGGFGSGKTSLLNMVLEELEFAASNIEDPEKPIILNFSPWSYSGQDQLIYSFFRRLSSILRAAPFFEPERKGKIIHLLELYISFFTHKAVPKALRPKQNIWKAWRQREDAFAWESGRDLTQVKAELNEELRKQPHKIIIIIDNISRLYDSEIKQMFQIIKSMGDYANTVYLLALDKEQVKKAIDRVDGFGGEAFLEKLVQLSFEVPEISRQDIENILLDKLQGLMMEVAAEDWSRTQWADVYYSSLRFFFHSCRDITRYVNVLGFSYPRLRDVVNAVDFFALTVIEVFMPDVYEGIRDNKDLFTDLVDGVFQFDEDKLRHEQLRCEEILSRSQRVSREVLLSLLMFLFPRVRKIYEPQTTFYYSDQEARNARRISCADVFESYFRLSMTSGYISEEEMKAILELAHNRQAFTQTLTRLNQDNRVLKFLDLLDTTALYKIPTKHVGPIIDALLDNGDLFPEGESTLLKLNTSMRIFRIIHQLLHRFSKGEERYSFLREGIAKAQWSLAVLVLLVRQLEAENLPMEYREVSLKELEGLKQAVVERIHYWVKIDRLMEHPKLLVILQAWNEWGSSEECRQYLQKITLDDRGLLAFLQAVFKEAIDQALSRYEETEVWQKNLELIGKFMPAKWLESHAKVVFEDLAFERLREREQLALMIYLDLMRTETVKVIPRTVD